MENYGQNGGEKLRTYVFIDGQNLNLAIKSDVLAKTGKVLYRGKKIDYRKLRHYLYQKYKATKCIIFLGYLEKNEQLYKYFRHCGFEIVFKTTTTMKIRDQETIKGNVDIDIAVYAAARTINEYDRAVFVSGDGDFLELYDYIDEQKKLHKILIPNSYRYSRLLKKYQDKIVYLNHNKEIFEKTKKLSRSSVSFGQRFRSDKSLGVSGHRDDDRNIAQKKAKGNSTNKKRRSR